MVDRITKTLRKLPPKERRAIQQMMRRIRQGDTGEFDVKKLRGGTNLYRARKGKLRIVYVITGRKYELLDVNRRSDTTYKRY